MRETDIPEFTTLLDSTCRLLSRGTYTPDDTNTTLWFRALAAHHIDDIRAAFSAHVRDPQRGRFVPSPADILAQIQAAMENDGRPGPEEAWAIALRSDDEFATVVWTQEIAQAKQAAQSLLDIGDEVGARMAFREAYNRIVAEARAAGVAPKWLESLGFDTAGRETALRAAVSAGRLPALPAPKPQALLPGVVDDAKLAADRLAEVWARYRAAQAARKPLQWAHDLKAREQAWRAGDRAVEPLSEALQQAWRNALEGSPMPEGFTGFKPIDPLALPPGMRPKRAGQAGPRQASDFGPPISAYDASEAA